MWPKLVKKDKGGWFGARAGYLRPVKLKLISPAKLIIKEVMLSFFCGCLKAHEFLWWIQEVVII